MIIVSYLKRIGYDWYRAVNEYSDNDKAKKFISNCLEENKRLKDKKINSSKPITG